jgi:hypothetical protein
MMLRLTVFSQQDTDTIPIKCFPERIVKSIAKDLIRGDSAIAEVKMLDTELILTLEKMVVKDSIILALRDKDLNNLHIINSEREKNSILEKNIKQLESDLKIAKTKNKFFMYVGPIILTSITIWAITK